jgi:hypothetical protein
MTVADQGDAAQTRQALVTLRRLREELAARGVSLSTILEEGETLRELAHAAGDGRPGMTVRKGRGF